MSVSSPTRLSGTAGYGASRCMVAGNKTGGLKAACDTCGQRLNGLMALHPLPSVAEAVTVVCQLYEAGRVLLFRELLSAWQPVVTIADERSLAFTSSVPSIPIFQMNAGGLFD